MEDELLEKSTLRKWQQMSQEEQRQELITIRQSRYFKLLPKRLQRKIDQII